jgi:hypothetical protein
MPLQRTALRSGFAAVTILVVLVATAIVGLQFVRNYIFGYVLIAILLEMGYLAIHFLLNVLFASKPTVARTVSRSIAGVVALAETLIIAVLTILILQSLATTVDTPSLIFTGVVVITIVIPTVSLWCYAIGVLRRRAYNDSLDRSGGSVFLK